MTIEERARDYACHVTIEELNREGLDTESFCGILHGYVRGATEQRKHDIEKACEWLGDNLIAFTEYDHLNGINIDYGQLNKQFRKAMEDEQ